jgi:phage-related protein
MSDNPLSGTVSLDTTNYKAGISELNRQIKVIETGFKSSAAAMGDWDKSSTGMEGHLKSLTSQAALQQQKVDGLNKVYKDLAAGGNTSAKALEELQIKVNLETERLNKMYTGIENDNLALIKMGPDAKNAGSGVGELATKEDAAEKKTITFKQAMGALGEGIKITATAVAATAAAVAGVGAAIAKLVIDAGNSASELTVLSEQTGISTQRLQELQYVAKGTGIDLSTITDPMGKLIRNMASAATQADKTGTSIESLKIGAKAGEFNDLGIAVQNSDGSFRNAKAVYTELITALKDTKDPVERDRIAFELFGVSAAKVSSKDLPALEKSMAAAKQQQEDFNQKIAAATDKTNPASAAFKDLGISVRDSSGQLRDSQTVMNETLAALGKIPNETQRDALAMAIFGKSALELNPLIEAGPKIANLSAEAHKMGAVMSDDSVKGLTDFHDMLDELGAGLQGTLGTLASAFLPGFQAVFGSAGNYLQQFSQIVSGSGGDLGKMADGLGQLVGTMANNVAAQAPKLLLAGLNILKGIVAALVKNLPALLPAVVLILTSLVTFITQTLPILMKAGVQLILALVKGILPQLPALLTAALQIIITIANGITDALPQLMPVIAEVIPQIILALINMLPLLIDAAAQLILALANGLVLAIPVLLPYIPKIIDAIVMALVNSLPILDDVAGKIITALREGIIKNAPLIGSTAVQIVSSLAKGIEALVLQLGLIGADIVKGLWTGIKNGWADLIREITGLVNLLPPAVRHALGMSSPSKVFAEIGANMALGLGAGFANQMQAVKRQINGAMNGFQGGNLALAGTGGGSYSSSSTANYYYGPVTIQQGQAGKPFAQQKASRF